MQAHATVARESTSVPTGRVGVWWFLASEIAIFGGAVACYVLFRARYPDWADQAARTLGWAGAFNTAVLLTSSLSAVLAHHAAVRGEAVRASHMLRWTAVGGLVFLAVKVYEYAHEISAGLVPAQSLFWSFYYLLTGLHALHVTAGIVALLAVAASARRGHALGRVELVALYWHFVDVVWIFLFPLLYLSS
ncbi:MAG: cytochrome c oxidase subunit 3 [Myxococcota bacterium]|nr:cytochrome c oxidase subunit 3 [Myxococcota bacterium]MDW8363723.1 cytochrome c oxidase subunit 3 [Myxococcales bacterium]